MKRLTFIAASAIMLAGCSDPSSEAPTVNVYNWSDYIAPTTNDQFTKKTGINVVYNVFDTNEVVDAKLMAGQSGYDIVVPSDNFFAKEVTAGLYQPLDLSKIPNYKNLNPVFMAKIAEHTDPGNRYGIPYMWGSTGIGYNPDKVKAVMGDDFVLDSWDAVFDPKIMKKLSQCGVAFLDSSDEMLPLVYIYKGESVDVQDPAKIEAAGQVISAVVPYVKYFHSSSYITDLANGDICVAVGWSGDVFQARDRAQEANNGVNINYVIPKEGGSFYFDMFGIPKDAPNPAAAHAYINFMLDPKNAADQVDYVAYGTPVLGVDKYLSKEVLADKGIFPPKEVMDKLQMHAVYSAQTERLMNRVWTKAKTGQ